mmetsp:Transcript_26011/g.81666  ORF Transcript_26011/g.81666 Transcript_26011/m.81666 type:complete len:193 (-) Transcript_26011:399-977(-)
MGPGAASGGDESVQLRSRSAARRQRQRCARQGATRDLIMRDITNLFDELRQAIAYDVQSMLTSFLQRGSVEVPIDITATPALSGGKQTCEDNAPADLYSGTLPVRPVKRYKNQAYTTGHETIPADPPPSASRQAIAKKSVMTVVVDPQGPLQPPVHRQDGCHARVHGPDVPGRPPGHRQDECHDSRPDGCHA